MRILVLGGSGMLGSMLVDYLSQYFQVIATVRDETLMSDVPNVTWQLFDACENNYMLRNDTHWVINAIGVIKQKLDDAKVAYQVNAEFPQWLSQLCGKKIIQIATDCVYSGQHGNYCEDSIHNFTDVYGASKSKGEVYSKNYHHLRCSIVGFENKEPAVSLLGWFLNLPKDAVIKGYTNHYWNGITTLHFAKMCKGIIENDVELPKLQHVVPADRVSKYDLLGYFRECFHREDIYIEPVVTTGVDRTLATLRPDVNMFLWNAAGYAYPPTIKQMVKELAEYANSNYTWHTP